MPGHLLHPELGRAPLPPRCLVGSGAVCHLQVANEFTSYAHALLSWTSNGWTVVDLGSRNGTRVNDRTSVREPVPLAAGDRIRFGSKDAWVLADDSAPEPFAMRLTDRTCVEAVEGTLILPSEEDPEASLYADPEGRWILQRDGGPEPIRHETVIALRDPWRMSLPSVGRQTQLAIRALDLAAMTLILRPSRNFEHVDAWLQHPDGVLPLGNAKHWGVALALAEDRIRDKGPAFDRGWMDLDQLEEETGVKRKSLDTYISRIRNQLQREGVLNAQDIVEGGRQNQRRLGTDGVRILRPGDQAPT